MDNIVEKKRNVKKHCEIEQQKMDDKLSYYSLKVEYNECLTEIIFSMFNDISKLMIGNWTYENDGKYKYCIDFGLLLSPSKSDRVEDIKKRLTLIEDIVFEIIEKYENENNIK